MSKKPNACNTLFVGNLDMETSEDDIRNFFAPYQVVGIAMRKGGYKGMAFAHVKFDSVDSCHRAAERAGERLKGNRLRLDWAVEKSGIPAAPTAVSGSSEQGRISEELRGQTPRIYVGSLTESMNEDDIRQAFSQFGEISLVKIHSDRRGHKSFGYVTFVSPQLASTAVDNGSSISVKGHRIRVDFARQELRHAQQPPHAEVMQERRPVTR
jgi:RNA recognition motif-containing protein